MPPRKKPAEVVEATEGVDEAAEETPQNEGVVEQTEDNEVNKEVDLQALIRSVVTDAVSPLHGRIAELEQQVSDLNNIIGAPEGAVEFMGAPSVIAPSLPDTRDIPEYRPDDREGSSTPWY